ncbi:hypothetical protein U91I_01792 [alpha proteobacterium U9-1i]|nr:hypothetical protein U91I_01792 [alpha proteobacterium U9-1i]
MFSAFGAFVFGFVLALLGVLCAYLTQTEYARQEESGADKIYFGMLHDQAKVRAADADETRHMKQGGRREWAAISCFLVSLIAFFVGASNGVTALV